MNTQMSDNNFFDPEKFSLIEYKLLKGQVNTPEDFNDESVVGYHVDNSLQLFFNMEDKFVKADYTAEIKSKSQGINAVEATGQFHFVFIYKVENLEELAKPDSNNMIELSPVLGNAVSSITYSTSRGILINHLQGTALQNFILPIINPNILLHNK